MNSISHSLSTRKILSQGAVAGGTAAPHATFPEPHSAPAATDGVPWAPLQWLGPFGRPKRESGKFGSPKRTVENRAQCYSQNIYIYMLSSLECGLKKSKWKTLVNGTKD